MKLKVIYEDNHLIAVIKEKGILTQGGSLNLPNLVNIIKDYIKVKYKKPGNVYLGLLHRLDTNVGGILLFAKTSKAASRISEDIRLNKFDKKYLAVVSGNVLDNEKMLVDYLYKDEREKKAIITSKEKGKVSKLLFNKITTINNETLLDINLITGRFHQIRAQLSNYGYPLVGDFKYGYKKQSYNILLYAYKISFNHPISKEKITLTHYPEDEFTKFLIKANII